MQDRPCRNPKLHQLPALASRCGVSPSHWTCLTDSQAKMKIVSSRKGTICFILSVSPCQFMLQRRYNTHSYSSCVRGSRLCPHVVPSPVGDMRRGRAAQGGLCGRIRQGLLYLVRGGFPAGEHSEPTHCLFLYEATGKRTPSWRWLKKGKAEPSSLRFCQAAWTLTGGEPASWKSTVCLMWKKTAFGEFNSHTGRSKEAR